MDNKFDLRKFLIENKLTANSKLLNEEIQIQPQQGDKASYEKLSKLFDWDDIDPDLGVEFSDEYGLEEFPEWEDQTWTDEIESHIKEQGAQMKKIATVGIKGTYIDNIDIYDIDGKYAALIDDYNQGCTVTSLQKGQDLIQQAQDIVDGKGGMNENALPDYEDATYPVAQAFKKAGVDMSRPIHVMYFADRWQEEDLGEKDPKQFAAELEQERKDFNGDLEPGDESMIIYEFENNTVDPVPDGLEYKLCFAVQEQHDYAILQAPSGMNENSGQVKVGDQVEYDGDQWVVVSVHGDEVSIVEIGQDGYTVQAEDIDERNPKVGDFVSGPGIDSNEALVVGISDEGIDVMELTDNGISVSMSDLQGGMNEGQIDLSSEKSIMKAIKDAAQMYMDDETSREEAMALAAEDIYDLARGQGNEDAMAIANSIIRGGMNESRRRLSRRRLNESKTRTQSRRRR